MAQVIIDTESLERTARQMMRAAAVAPARRIEQIEEDRGIPMKTVLLWCAEDLESAGCAELAEKCYRVYRAYRAPQLGNIDL